MNFIAVNCWWVKIFYRPTAYSAVSAAVPFSMFSDVKYQQLLFNLWLVTKHALFLFLFFKNTKTVTYFCLLRWIRTLKRKDHFLSETHIQSFHTRVDKLALESGGAVSADELQPGKINTKSARLNEWTSFKFMWTTTAGCINPNQWTDVRNSFWLYSYTIQYIRHSLYKCNFSFL